MAATRTNSAVIASGATVSGSIDLDSYGSLEGLVGFIMPAAFTGSAITFNVSTDDVTYSALNDSSNAAVSITVTAGKAYALKQDVRSTLSPWRYIQFVSGSSEGAARTITLLKK
jgi:hypothetical protein